MPKIFFNVKLCIIIVKFMSAKDFIYDVNNHSVNVIIFLLSINTGGKFI